MENVMQAGFCSLVMQPPLGLRIPGYYTVRLAEGLQILCICVPPPLPAVTRRL